MDPNPDYDASDEIEYGINWWAWILRGVYPPPAYPPVYALTLCRRGLDGPAHFRTQLGVFGRATQLIGLNARARQIDR